MAPLTTQAPMSFLRLYKLIHALQSNLYNGTIRRSRWRAQVLQFSHIPDPLSRISGALKEQERGGGGGGKLT